MVLRAVLVRLAWRPARAGIPPAAPPALLRPVRSSLLAAFGDRQAHAAAIAVAAVVVGMAPGSEARCGFAGSGVGGAPA